MDFREIHAEEAVGENYYRELVGWIFTANGMGEYTNAGMEILRCESQFGAFTDNQLGPWQFHPTTWAGTPQGKAGMSAEDPVASTEAAAWMIKQGRIREWSCYRPIKIADTGSGGYLNVQ